MGSTLAVDTETAGSVIEGWSGVITYEGIVTGDRRIIDVDALVWDTPMPLRYTGEDNGGHDGARIVGRIDRIWRADNGEIRAEGVFDIGSELGVEVSRLVAQRFLTGISIDLDEVAYEWRDADGSVADAGDELLLLSDDDTIFATTSARIRAATLVAIPAFREASIDVDPDYVPLPDEITASAAATPINPPAAWFDDPQLDESTPLVVTDDGRVYGHLATWGVCHTGIAAAEGYCVTPPRSKTNYSTFHTGTLLTGDDTVISVGRITINTTHATPTMSAAATRDHYEVTGSAVADVRVGEDSHGIWVAGALRPSADALKARELRSSPLSGDWRLVDGNLELFAVLAVNVPGFPIPRPAGMVASGQITALLAAGMLPPRSVQRRNSAGESLSDSDITYLKRLARDARDTHRQQLARRVRAAQLRSKAIRLGVL